MKLPDDFDIDSLPVIGEGAAQTPQAQATTPAHPVSPAPATAPAPQTQPQAEGFDLDSLPEIRRFRMADGEDIDVDERAIARLRKGQIRNPFAPIGTNREAARAKVSRKAWKEAGLPEKYGRSQRDRDEVSRLILDTYDREQKEAEAARAAQQQANKGWTKEDEEQYNEMVKLQAGMQMASQERPDIGVFGQKYMEAVSKAGRDVGAGELVMRQLPVIGAFIDANDAMVNNNFRRFMNGEFENSLAMGNAARNMGIPEGVITDVQRRSWSGKRTAMGAPIVDQEKAAEEWKKVIYPLYIAREAAKGRAVETLQGAAPLTASQEIVSGAVTLPKMVADLTPIGFGVTAIPRVMTKAESLMERGDGEGTALAKAAASVGGEYAIWNKLGKVIEALPGVGSWVKSAGQKLAKSRVAGNVVARNAAQILEMNAKSGLTELVDDVMGMDKADSEEKKAFSEWFQDFVSVPGNLKKMLMMLPAHLLMKGVGKGKQMLTKEGSDAAGMLKAQRAIIEATIGEEAARGLSDSDVQNIYSFVSSPRLTEKSISDTLEFINGKAGTENRQGALRELRKQLREGREREGRREVAEEGARAAHEQDMEARKDAAMRKEAARRGITDEADVKKFGKLYDEYSKTKTVQPFDDWLAERGSATSEAKSEPVKVDAKAADMREPVKDAAGADERLPSDLKSMSLDELAELPPEQTRAELQRRMAENTAKQDEIRFKNGKQTDAETQELNRLVREHIRMGDMLDGKKPSEQKAETPAETPKNGPTSAPREEGTTTPPNGAEPPQGGKTAENVTEGRSVSADTIGGEPQTTPEPPSTPAPEPKKPFGTGDSSHGQGKYSRKNYDSDAANTGATGAATWHWQNGERVYSLPVDFSQTRPGGPVVLDKTDSAYERIKELLNGRQLVMTKSGKIQFKGEFKGAVPTELRELLGRELKIGKNPDAPSKDDLYGVNKGQFGEEASTTWEEVEKAVAADRENYHNWQKRQQRADRRASEEKKLEKKVRSGKATQNELDILRHRNMMEDYLDQGGKETDEDYKAMERDLEVLQESGTYDYEGLSKAKDAADKFRDAEWENAIGDIESGEGDFSPSDQYVKPFTRENLQGAKKGDIIHFDHDEVKYELDRYDPETGVMDVYRSDENGVKRRFKVSRNGVEEIRNDGKGQKGVVQDNAGDAGGGGRPAPGAAGGEARGAEGAAGRGSGAGGAEASKPADLTLESLTPEQQRAERERIAQQQQTAAQKAEMEERRTATLKGGTGDLGQQTLDLGGAEGEQDLFNRREARQEEALSLRLKDQKFKDWAKKHGVTPTKDHLEMYDREQAKGAFAVAKRWIRGIKAKFESRPPTDADLGANDRAIRNVRGDIIGKWDKATGEVTFYPGANAETVAHEIGWHATYDHAEKLAAQGDRRLLDKLNAYARGAQQATWTKTLTRYGMASDPRMIIDEVGAARFTAEQAMKIKNEVDRRAALKWYGKAWEACRDAYKSMLTKMGFNKTSVDALNGMSPERAVEFMATEMARGKTLAKVEAKKVPGVNDALTAKEKYVRAAKDSMHVLKWVDEVTGGRFHLHRDQKLSHGMKQKAFDRAMQFWNEMATECKAAGIKLTELDEYIRAKGAADTNRRIKALNGNENGAGISDVDAARTVLQYERGTKGAAMKRIAQKLWDLQHEGLMERVNAGLVDAQFAADLEANEPFHVPRHNRFDANGEFTGYETNAQLAANEWHKAEGRTTDSANAVGWIMQEYCDAFSRGAENRVRQRLAQALLASNGVLGNATVVTPANEARLAEKTKANKNGNAQVVIVKQGGKKVALELNGVRGEAVARALTGRDMKEMPSWVKKTLRIWASTATEWSPTFALRNLTADLADVMLLNIGDHGIVKGLKRDAGHIKAMATLARDIRRYVKTGKTNNALLNEAIGAGILIGGMGREGFTDPNEAHAFFRDRMLLYGEEGLKRAARRGVMGAKNVAKSLFGWVETINKTTELMNRLADYKKSRDMGMSARDAAAHARDITVDFNEKGEWTGVSNALYMFSNSTMGAAFRQVKGVTGKHWKGLVGTALAIGFAEGLAEVMNGDEDDADKAGTGTGKDVNEYTRANSLYLRFGKTTVRTPFHAGPLSVIKYTGNCAARYMAGLLNDKNKSAVKGSEAAANIGKEASGLITHFLGLGDAGPNVMQTITPSVLQWLVQLGQNRDYADRPIAKPKFDEAMPSSENGRRSTAEGYKDIARLLNEWSGGNAGRKGSVDYAPEQYKVVSEAVGKNVLRDVTSTAQTIGYVIDLFRGNADIDTRNIPVVRDFVRVNHSGNTQRYYEAATDYREDRYELQKMVAQWTPEERKAYVEKHPWARNPEVNKAIQKIGELQKYEDGFVKNGRGWVKRKEPPTEEQKAKWKAARLRYQAMFLEYAEKHGGVH